MRVIQSAALDLTQAENPVDLLARTLEASGGIFSMRSLDGIDTVYFQPDGQRLAEFHTAERSGALENHNTPAVEDLFARTIFTIAGRAHICARKILFRFFGAHGKWHDEIASVVSSWAKRATETRQIDLLEQTRLLAVDVFSKVVFGLESLSSGRKRVGLLVQEFVTGAVEAAKVSPDPIALQRAAMARDKLLGLARAVGAEDGHSFAAYCLRNDPSLDGVRDVSAVLIALVETTANMLAWNIARWTLAPASGQEDIEGFVRQIEILDSPNTIVIRRVVTSMPFQGFSLEPGALLAYSPAIITGSEAIGNAEAFTFGSGPRSCPGRSMARYIVTSTLTALAAQPSRWTIANGELPRPIAWFPVRTFGLGTVVRTCA